ncbi:MAG TPA: hypothetical protein VFX53_17110 [Pedococcus sp.]|nr:hypothetical protein [Pedococcus sp.]
MPDLATLASHKSELIRKALEGSVFVAPFSANPITTLTSGGSSELAALPTGYTDVGLVEKGNAVTWSRSVTTQEVMVWGDLYPARRDITKDDSTLKFTMVETKRLSMELYYGMDLSSTTADATTGEVSFAQPARPSTKFWRVFGIFQDGTGSDAIYVGRFYPRASVTDMSDQKWDDDADPLLWDISMSAVRDDDLGYAVKHFFGGPGWEALLDDLDFTQGS